MNKTSMSQNMRKLKACSISFKEIRGLSTETGRGIFSKQSQMRERGEGIDWDDAVKWNCDIPVPN